MIIVIQRVNRASVSVDHRVVGQIAQGMLALVGIEKNDSVQDAVAAAHKLVHLRIFPGRTPMDRNLLDINAACLLVSQFTLLGRTDKGRRPSFDRAASPEAAHPLFQELVQRIRGFGIEVATGVFGAHMEVDLCNDGPVTLVYQTKNEPGNRQSLA